MQLRRAIAPFLVALIAAAAAIITLRGVLEAPKAQRAVTRRPVVVAVREISQGGVVELSNVAISAWPEGAVPIGAYSVLDSVVGRVARSAIFKGEVIMPNRLSPRP